MARIIEFYDNASSASPPVIGDTVAANLTVHANDAAYEAANTGAPAQGNIYMNSTDETVRYYTGSAWEAVGTYTEDDNIRQTQGVNIGDTDLGTFPGSTIADGNTVKGALGDLETALEGIPAGLVYQGNWNASTNSPSLVSSTGTVGHYYSVSVAGSTNLDGITDWAVNDWAIFSDTGVWQKIDNSETVVSIDDLSDVDTSTVAPANGNALIWDGSEWVPGAGGGGQGGINYIVNHDFEIDSSGSNIGGTTTVSLDTTTPIRGTQSLEINFPISAVVDTDFCALEMSDVDAADIGKKVYVSFDYTTDANYVSDNVKMYLSNADSATLEPITGGNGSGLLTASEGKISTFTGVCYLPPTDNTFELTFMTDTTFPAAATITVDNVKVGPDAIIDADTFQTEVLTSSGAQSISNATFTALTGGSFTADASGFLQVTWAGIFAASVLGDRGCELVDSSNVRVVLGEFQGAVAGGVTGYTLSGGFNAVAGETYTIRGYQSTGGALNIDSWDASFNLRKTGAVLSTTEMMNTTVKARATTDTAQGMTGTIAIIDYEDVDFDDLGNVTTGAGWKFTATKAGVYEVDAALMYVSTAWSALSVIRLDLYKNGVAYSTLDYQTFSSAATQFEQVKGHDSIELQKGDYIDIRSSHTNGGTINTHTNSVYNHISIKQTMDNSVYSVYGEALKTQTKYLSADVSTNITMSDLTFSDLTIGKWYEINAQFDLSTNSTDNDIAVTVNHNSAVIASKLQNSTASSLGCRYACFVKFKAETTTITFVTSSASANAFVRGDGTKLETWAELSEIGPHVETTGW